MTNVDQSPEMQLPVIGEKQAKDVKQGVWMGFILAMVGTVLNLRGIGIGTLLSLASPALILGVYLFLEKGNRQTAILCAAGELAIKVLNLLLNVRNLGNPMSALVMIAHVVIAAMLLLMVMGKLKNGTGFWIVLAAAIVTMIPLLMNYAHITSGDFLPIILSLAAGIGRVMLVVYVFARMLDAAQYKRFTVGLAFSAVVAVVIAVVLLLVLMSMPGADAPKDSLTEAQEWVWNNFRVDSDGNLYWK